MDRKHYADEHRAFAEAFRAFADKVVALHYLDWERAGLTPREVFQEAGRGGFLGIAVPEEYGGGRGGFLGMAVHEEYGCGGVDDFRFNQVLGEQIGFAGITCSGLGISLHNDI